MNRQRDNRQGFTLIELMVVITIMVILAAIAVGVGMYANSESMKKQTQTTEKIALHLAQSYCEITGSYPTSVAALVSAISFSGTTTNDKYATMRNQLRNMSRDTFNGSNTFYDAWGRALQYSSTGSVSGGPLFTSAGHNGVFGDKDDIRSDDMPVGQ